MPLFSRRNLGEVLLNSVHCLFAIALLAIPLFHMTKLLAQTRWLTSSSSDLDLFREEGKERTEIPLSALY